MFGEIYLTIWFVSILFFCYGFFVFSRKDIYKPIVFFSKLSVVVIFISSCYLYTFENSLKIFMKDFSIYLLFFTAGMFCSKVQLTEDYNCLHIGNGILGSLLLLIIYKAVYINTWYEYAVYCLLVLSTNMSLLYLLCVLLHKNNLVAMNKDSLFKYFPASFLRLIKNKYLHLANVVLSAALMLLLHNMIYINTWFEYIVSSFFTVSFCTSFLYLLFVLLSLSPPPSKRIIKLLSKYSYASFCVFLFHRSIWGSMALLWPKGSFAQWFFVIVVGIPIIITLSYFIQLFYNFILQYCTQGWSRGRGEPERLI